MRATDWMGRGSDGYLLGIAIVLSLISLTTVWFGFVWAYRASGINAALVAGLGSVFWYELIYYAPKCFNEVLAGHLLLPGLYLGVYGQQDLSRRKWRLFLAGVFLGLAVALRMQLAPAVLFAAVYFCWKRWKESLLPVAAGGSLSVLFFGLVDALTWSSPFHSYVAMLRFQIAGTNTGGRYNRGIIFGSTCCLHYGPLILFALIGGRRSPFLGCIVLAIMIPHTFIPHKEWRYIYPAMPLLITLSGIGVTEAVSALNARLKSPRSAWAVWPFGVQDFCWAHLRRSRRYFPHGSRMLGT